MIEHKENCLIINGKQSVKLKSGSISFTNYFKQLPVPSMLLFKIYADFECLLKEVKSSNKNNGSYTVACIDNKLSKKVVFYRGKSDVCKFIETILEEYDYCEKMTKKHFNKNLIMSAEEEERFQLSNSCWIFDKLFDVEDDKVRDHCRITGKYRGVAHWICNINLELSKKIPVIFHNLRGYNNHLIIKKIGKVDVRLSAIPNGLEKYMAFTVNRNLFIIDACNL